MWSDKNWVLEHSRELAIFAILFLVSSLSFGIGYLLARDFDQAPIIIEKCDTMINDR
jgi:hypothetical protein